MICVSIAAPTNEMALANMAEAYRLTDLVELRLDLIRRADLVRLIGAKTGKIIVTNRRREEGGGCRGSEKDRVALLKEAVMLGAEYVDIEMETDRGLKEDLAQTVGDLPGRTKMIVSWHDSRKTPPERALRERMRFGIQSRADIVKLIPFARDLNDNLRILNLLVYAGEKEQDIIAFCMGAKGRLSRIMAPCFGSCISYASLGKKTAVAPGQMSVDAMRDAFRVIQNESTER